MAVHDFKGFKPRQAGGLVLPGGGQEIPTAPAQVRDTLGRVLAVGDMIRLEQFTTNPYRVQSVQPVPAAPGMMEVVLQSTQVFIAQRDQPNQEFLRIMTVQEIAERKLGRLQAAESSARPDGTMSPPPEKPDAPPEPPTDDTPTLKDA